MASKAFNRSGLMSFDVNPSPETMFHFPISPGEPGKFDFYRVHLANHTNHSDTMFSDNSDAPVLSASNTSTSIATRRWTPFADLVPDQSKCSISSNSISASKILPVISNDSNILVNTNVTQNESIQSSSLLTDAVKNAMKKGHLDVPTNQTRRPLSGTTLSSKDLNHLSPQSM